MRDLYQPLPLIYAFVACATDSAWQLLRKYKISAAAVIVHEKLYSK